MVKHLTIRIKFNTLTRLKKQFPAYPKEAMIDYFERLAKYLEEIIDGI